MFAKTDRVRYFIVKKGDRIMNVLVTAVSIFLFGYLVMKST